MAKRKKVNQYVPNDYQMNARIWCIRNNIKILPEPTHRGIYLILDVLGVMTKSPDPYTNDTLNPKIFQLYEYLYKKYY